MSPSQVDVVIVGGGPAGLSAALVLGRARQRVLVVDAGSPANAVTGGVGGLLGHPGDAPASVLRAAGAAQLRELGTVSVRSGLVRDARRDGADGFVVDVDGSRVRTHAILLASGLRYVPPELPGLWPLWGRSVFHCPFCDGWEARDRALAVHADGAVGVRRGLLLRAWSDDVLVIGRLSVADRAELVAAGVRTCEEPIAGLEADPSDPARLRAIHFADGSVEARDALFVAPRLERPDTLADALGCAARQGEPALLAVDAGGRTSVPGVYAAGDLGEPERSVANAIGSGARVGKAMVLDLVRPTRPATQPSLATWTLESKPTPAPTRERLLSKVVRQTRRYRASAIEYAAKQITPAATMPSRTGP